MGWIDNGLLWAAGTGDHGVSEDASNVVVAYTLLGDANCDGTVNGTDLDLLAENWGQPAPRPPGPRAISTTGPARRQAGPHLHRW